MSGMRRAMRRAGQKLRQGMRHLLPPMLSVQYKPHEGYAQDVMIRQLAQVPPPAADALPVPPRGLSGYAPEDFVAAGREHTATMRRILADAGFALAPEHRILDFGCGAARMLRFFADHAATGECWGVDSDGKRLAWCMEHLTPPFHFALTTRLPHLPFEDRWFDLVFAGSVFTHIDDLMVSWLLELRRVLAPGGYAYLTLHDNHYIELLDRSLADRPLNVAAAASPNYRRFAASRFGAFVIARFVRPQVFVDRGYFRRIVAPMYEVLGFHEQAYGAQTAVVLRRK